MSLPASRQGSLGAKGDYQGKNNNKNMTRSQWLKDKGMTEADVMQDEEGEFVWQDPEIMDEGENENYKPHKVYLPLEEFQAEDDEDLD
jgi:hypothetical protein